MVSATAGEPACCGPPRTIGEGRSRCAPRANIEGCRGPRLIPHGTSGSCAGATSRRGAGSAGGFVARGRQAGAEKISHRGDARSCARSTSGCWPAGALGQGASSRSRERADGRLRAAARGQGFDREASRARRSCGSPCPDLVTHDKRDEPFGRVGSIQPPSRAAKRRCGPQPQDSHQSQYSEGVPLLREPKGREPAAAPPSVGPGRTSRSASSGIAPASRCGAMPRDSSPCWNRSAARCGSIGR
jgi:hypothetical protein